MKIYENKQKSTKTTNKNYTHKKIVKIICKIFLYAQDFILEWTFNL